MKKAMILQYKPEKNILSMLHFNNYIIYLVMQINDKI